MRNKPQQEGLRWLRQAEEDMRWTRRLAEEGAYHLACFLAQQVTEKALKAFLYAQGEEIVLGHSVERLVQSAAAYEPAFLPRGERWFILDSYYITARYPNGLPDGIPADIFTQETAEHAVSIAEDAYRFVASLITEAD